MKTDDLVDLLATGTAPVERDVPARRFRIALSIAAVGALCLMMIVFGVRPDLASVMQTARFWEKLAFPLCVAIGALTAAARLARPGAVVGIGWLEMAIPVALVWVGGLFIVVSAEPPDRLLLVLGQTWRTCPFNILLLSIPGFVAIFWAIKGLAPTRPGIAGAVAGLLASSIATVAYCLHCPEMSPAFWGIWYVLGMALPAALGAWLGPRLLRW